MSPALDWLQSTFQSSLPSAADEPCPSAEQLWGTAVGELRREEATDVVMHSARCARCASALRMALEMEGASARPVRPARTWRLGWLGLGAAVAAALAVAVIELPRLWRPEVMVRERGAPSTGLRSLLPPGPRPRAGLALAWSSEPGALRYQVTLATLDLQVRFQKAGVTGTRVEVPESALAGLPAGSRLVWRVEAVLGDGRTVDSPGFDLILQ